MSGLDASQHAAPPTRRGGPARWHILPALAALAVPLALVAEPRVLAVSLAPEVLFVLPGLLLVRAATNREAGWLPMVAFGPAIGFGLSCLTLLALWLAGARGAWTLVAAPALVAVLLPLAAWVPDRWRFPATRPGDAGALAAVLLIVPLVVSAPFANVGADTTEGKAYRAYFTADYVWRRAVVAELAKGDVLPVNPFFRDDALHYYWLPHLASAVTYRNMTTDLDEVLLVHSVVADVAFVTFLYGLARWFVPTPGAAALGVFTLVFCSSFEGLYALWDLWRSDAPLSLVRYLNIDAVSRWTFQGMPIDGLQRVLFYQPHHALGYALGMLGVLAVAGRRQRYDPVALATAGTLLGMSTLISSFAGLMLTSVAALWEGVSVLRHRDWWRAVSHVAAASLPLVLAAALVTALQYVDGGGGSVIILGANPVAFHEVWRSTALSFGPVLVITALAAARLVRTGDRQAWVFATMLVVCALFYFFVDVRDHQDVYVGWRVGHLWFISSVALAAVVYQWVSAMPAGRRGGSMAALAAVLLAALPTTLIDIYNTQDITNRQEAAGFTWTLVLSPAEQEAFAWIRTHTPPAAVFQLDAEARGVATWAYLPAFAERRMGVGLPISMVPLKKYQDGARSVTWLFEATDARWAQAFAARNGIEYLFIGQPERERHSAFEALLASAPASFDRVFHNDAASIYHVKVDSQSPPRP